MLNLDWETILLIITILGGIASIIDILEGVVCFVKWIIKVAEWIIDKVQNARKK